ncbi:MAG: hypothetical protein KH319_06445 [Butyricicoccus pullicaecorum]|nr:hypothetical protein [Butyricicoccus pullicaecorum]
MYQRGIPRCEEERRAEMRKAAVCRKNAKTIFMQQFAHKYAFAHEAILGIAKKTSRNFAEFDQAALDILL